MAAALGGSGVAHNLGALRNLLRARLRKRRERRFAGGRFDSDAATRGTGSRNAELAPIAENLRTVEMTPDEKVGLQGKAFGEALAAKRIAWLATQLLR